MPSTENYYSTPTALTANFQKFDFGFEANHLMIIHDGTGKITWSWNGQTGTNDGDLEAADSWIALDGMEKSRMFVKSDNPGDVVRIWAWKGES